MEDLKKIAIKRHWQLNPNEKQTNALLKALNFRKKSSGHYYCPCKGENKRKNICPCGEAKKEIKLNGKCHCGLFFK